MSNESFTTKHRTLGRVAAWAVFSVSVIYTVTLVLGFLSLKSPQEPIGDPYFSILELLIILLAPLMVVSMVAVHAYASPEDKAYSFTALAFMILLAGTTSSVHFVVLTVSRQIESTGLTWAPLFFSFKWPSVAYILTPEYNCARIKLTVPRTGCTLCELKFSSHTGGSHDQEQDSEVRRIGAG